MRVQVMACVRVCYIQYILCACVLYTHTYIYILCVYERELGLLWGGDRACLRSQVHTHVSQADLSCGDGAMEIAVHALHHMLS